jgi:hypothetical protein
MFFVCFIYAKKMFQGIGMFQGSFNPRSKLHAKNVFWAPQRGFDGASSMQKPPSQKHQTLASIG